MTERDLHFVALLGSLRRRSFCRAIADTLDEIAPNEVRVTVLDTAGELPHYNQDIENCGIPDQVRDMAVAIGEADAVIIVTPEYNHSVPGVLKNALDWLSRSQSRPFAGKPVAIQTASPGPFGGLRSQHHLRQILMSLDALVLNKPEIIIPKVGDRIDIDTRTLRDDETRNHIAAQLAALVRLSRTSGSCT